MSKYRQLGKSSSIAHVRVSLRAHAWHSRCNEKGSNTLGRSPAASKHGATAAFPLLHKSEFSRLRPSAAEFELTTFRQTLAGARHFVTPCLAPPGCISLFLSQVRVRRFGVRSANQIV